MFCTFTMKMQNIRIKIFFWLSIILFAAGCRKDLPTDKESAICYSCLPGNWQLVDGVKIMGNDTAQKFENGLIIEYRDRKRDPYTKNGHLFLNIQGDTFSYDELVAGEDYWNNDTLRYTANWKWLSSSYSKSLLKIRMRFWGGDMVEVFKVIKLTGSELEVEVRQAMGAWSMYMRVRFIRTGNPLPENQVIEKTVPQYPSEILGTWVMTEFLQKTNDSVFFKYTGDTLTSQTYQSHYSHYGPPTWTKEVYKTPYHLAMVLEDFGILTTSYEKDHVAEASSGYWYWTDDLSLHKKIYVEPMLAKLFTDYDLTKLDQDSLIIQYQNNWYYKFVRKK